MKTNIDFSRNYFKFQNPTISKISLQNIYSLISKNKLHYILFSSNLHVKTTVIFQKSCNQLFLSISLLFSFHFLSTFFSFEFSFRLMSAKTSNLMTRVVDWNDCIKRINDNKYRFSKKLGINLASKRYVINKW